MSNKGDLPLYFIALVPPDPVKHDAQQWKEYFASTYNSKGALRSAPHITLHMPFRIKEEKEAELIAALSSITAPPIAMDVDGYGCFEPKVIYMNVLNNDPLQALFDQVHRVMKKDFGIVNADYKYRGFHPHITIAFRDLRKTAFKLAWEEFKTKSYQQQFTAQRFSLLKHNGKRWEEYKTFSLSE